MGTLMDMPSGGTCFKQEGSWTPYCVLRTFGSPGLKPIAPKSPKPLNPKPLNPKTPKPLNP